MNGAIPVTLSDQELIRAGGAPRFFASRHASGIRARAMRRAGELLKQIEPATGKNNQYAQVKGEGAHLLQSRQKAASDAGMSDHQAKTAQRIASIPAAEFEKAVESPTPPTITTLAQQGIGKEGAAQRIKLRFRRSAEDIIEIGRDLLAVKERIGHGNFTPWLQAEFGMSESAANKMMAVARVYGSKSVTVTDLPVTALYELAAPKTPLEVREEIEKMIYSQDRRTNIPDSIAAARNIAIASLGSVSPLIEPSQAWIAFRCIGPANGAQRLNRTFCATSLESTSHMRWVAGIFTRTGLGQWVSRSDMVSPPETLSNSATQSLFPGGAA